jgi:purine-nucleoside phosphorylase
MIHRLGGDVVGMSTIPEVLVAKQAGMKILVISLVTNVCYPLNRIAQTNISEVVRVAKESEPKVSFIITELIKELNNK